MKKKLSVKGLVKRYYHAWTFLYLIIYFSWFAILEKLVNTNTEYYLIHVPLDDLIPFCEVFVLPYLIWFVYIFAIGGWLMLVDRKDFYRMSLFFYTGMTIFLIISTFWHNGQALRPDLTALGRDNIFIHMTQKYVYGHDTPTNIFPSIHVYNTIGACIAIIKTKHIPRRRLWAKILLVLQGFLIILSTVFLKQHSVVDVIGAIVMAVPMYFFVYNLPMKRVKATVDEPIFIEK